MSSSKPVQILSADWHCQERAWERYPELAGDSYYALTQVVTLCLDLCVPLIGAGDLIDNKRPSPKTIEFLRSECERLYKANLYVGYIRGNHDFTDPPWLSLFPSAYHINNSRFLAGGLTILGLDYTTRDQLKEELDKIKCVDVLICHQTWSELNGGRGDASLSDISGVRCLVSGDLHKTIIRRETVNGKPLIAISPGSLCMQSIDEPEDKFVLVLHDDLSVEKIKLKSRPVFRATVSSHDELDECCVWIAAYINAGNDLPGNISKPIIDVQLLHGLRNASSILTHITDGKAHLFIRPLDKPIDQVKKELINSVEPPGLLDALEEDLPKDGRAYSQGSRLLASDKPSSVMAEIEAEIMSNHIL